jgi:hypothetical protein
MITLRGEVQSLIVCPPVLSSIPDRVPEMTRTGHLAFIPVYIIREALKIGLYCIAPFLIKV